MNDHIVLTFCIRPIQGLVKTNYTHNWDIIMPRPLPGHHWVLKNVTVSTLLWFYADKKVVSHIPSLISASMSLFRVVFSLKWWLCAQSVETGRELGLNPDVTRLFTGYQYRRLKNLLQRFSLCKPFVVWLLLIIASLYTFYIRIYASFWSISEDWDKTVYLRDESQVYRRQRIVCIQVHLKYHNYSPSNHMEFACKFNLNLQGHTGIIIQDSTSSS